MKTCEYCGRENEKKAEKCSGCGAKLPEKMLYRSGPTYFHGYLLYHLSEGLIEQKKTIQLWLGERLIREFTIPMEMIEKFVPEGCDGDDFLLGLVKVALGEQEVLRVETTNQRRPVKFEIRQIEEPDITLDDLYATLAA